MKKLSWFKAFTHIRHCNNGKDEFEKSTSKLIRSIIGLLLICLLLVVVAAFGLKIVLVFRVSELQNKFLSAGVLGVFSGLSGMVGILLGYLQKNYTEHKQNEREHIGNGGQNE